MCLPTQPFQTLCLCEIFLQQLNVTSRTEDNRDTERRRNIAGVRRNHPNPPTSAKTHFLFLLSSCLFPCSTKPEIPSLKINPLGGKKKINPFGKKKINPFETRISLSRHFFFFQIVNYFERNNIHITDTFGWVRLSSHFSYSLDEGNECHVGITGCLEVRGMRTDKL